MENSLSSHHSLSKSSQDIFGQLLFHSYYSMVLRRLSDLNGSLKGFFSCLNFTLIAVVLGHFLGLRLFSKMRGLNKTVSKVPFHLIFLWISRSLAVTFTSWSPGTLLCLLMSQSFFFFFFKANCFVRKLITLRHPIF